MSQSIKDVQNKILETMKYIDELCEKYNITYYIMGGTALGAVRHGGFIPWDDDLDIFMTIDNYEKFKYAFSKEKSNNFVLQEWKTTKNYLEYAKVRMNGTTFIESHFKDRLDMHHGIYVDIMILHKAPKSTLMKRLLYIESKYVTLYALSQRNWKPKTSAQKIVLNTLKLLPNKFFAWLSYKHIYYFDNKEDFNEYCYWITPAKFKKGLFKKNIFSTPIEIKFEDTNLKAPTQIKEYLSLRYGDYMKLPSVKEQEAAIHAEIFDCIRDYSEYIR